MNITEKIYKWETIWLSHPPPALIPWCWWHFIDLLDTLLPTDYQFACCYFMPLGLYARHWLSSNTPRGTFGISQGFIVSLYLMGRLMISFTVDMLGSALFKCLNLVPQDVNGWAIIHFFACLFSFLWCGLFKLIIL